MSYRERSWIIAVGKDMYAEFECIRNGCEYKDYYSILDFFLEKSWKSRRPWNMTESLEEFKKEEKKNG